MWSKNMQAVTDLNNRDAHSVRQCIHDSLQSRSGFPRTTKQLENVTGTSCSHNDRAMLLATARNKLENVTVPKFKVQLFGVIGSSQHELPSGDSAGSIVFENGPNVATDYDAGRIPLRFKLLNTSETPSESGKKISMNVYYNLKLCCQNDGKM
ncbi:hypothetical protein Tco_0400285 [Tanacetum coccineum]